MIHIATLAPGREGSRPGKIDAKAAFRAINSRSASQIQSRLFIGADCRIGHAGGCRLSHEGLESRFEDVGRLAVEWGEAAQVSSICLSTDPCED